MALYDAFISYSHAKDKPIAAALQSAVQKLGKPWYRRRALRLFRDDTSLSATPHLWPTIEQALGQSRFFLLLASPEAAASKWVNKEVSYWLEHNSINTVLIGLTDGELNWDEAVGDFSARERHPLPPALAKRFENEPKWVDLCPYRAGASKRDAKFTELGADFAAAIRGMLKEDLLSQEVRQQRRALALASGAVVLLLLLAIAVTTASVWLIREVRAADYTLGGAVKASTDSVFRLARAVEHAPGIPPDAIKDVLDRILALQEQVAEFGQVTPSVKRAESDILSEIAETSLARGDLTRALAAAKQALQIDMDLVAAGSTGLQRDLSVAYNDLGDVQMALGDLVVALESYRDSLVIRQRLAAFDPSNKERQDDLDLVIRKIGGIAYSFVLAHDFPTALTAADQAISLAPDKIWLYSNRAHALMFLGRTGEARALYLKYRRETDVQPGKSWEALILAGREMRANGLSNPLMDEIEPEFKSPQPKSPG